MQSNDELIQKMNKILQANVPPEWKYEALHALDVEIQNDSEDGIASPLIFVILDEQHKLIKEINGQ